MPGILPEGLAVLAGKPKLGKSWLALQLALAVASGGSALGIGEIVQGPALYLALEDGRRRLQNRLMRLRESQPGPVPANLYFARQWARQDKGGLAQLAEWLTAHPGTRLVVIDTYPLFRPAHQSKGGSQTYSEDYLFAATLKQLADQFQVCILLVCHCRKAGSDDFQDEIMGSQGLSGAADASLVLRRETWPENLLSSASRVEISRSRSSNWNLTPNASCGCLEPRRRRSPKSVANG